MLVPSVSLVSCRQPSELQINPAGTESRAGTGNQQLYELSPAPWVRGCSTPEIGLGLSRVPPWSEWGPPSQVGSPPLLRQPSGASTSAGLLCPISRARPAPTLLFPWVWGCNWEDATSFPKHEVAEILCAAGPGEATSPVVPSRSP